MIRILLILILCLPAFAEEKTKVGPENGTLFIVGGGYLSEDLVKRFIELAGGPDAPIIVVPTAGSIGQYTEERADFLREAGAKSVTLLHTTDREEADSEEFSKPLLKAAAVWFNGGRQWRLVDAYKDTLTEKRFHDLLARGGVIGGSSAGATIQGSYLVRGDTKNNQIMMGNHEVGFGFMRNTAIDQHLLARNRHFDIFEVLQAKPELLGIGIDEDTAIEVKGDEFVVHGKSYTVVYDGNFWSREGSSLKKLPPKEQLFYFLRAGDRYDLKNRKVL